MNLTENLAKYGILACAMYLATLKDYWKVIADIDECYWESQFLTQNCDNSEVFLLVQVNSC